MMRDQTQGSPWWCLSTWETELHPYNCASRFPEKLRSDSHNIHRSRLTCVMWCAGNLNASDAENLLGYDIHSSALADILSDPSLSTPITVGLYAKWGSGKSFLISKLQSESQVYFTLCWTHSVPHNEVLVLHGCAHAACGAKPSFWKLSICCLGKHSQSETDYKTNFLLMKGENSTTSYCIVWMFKLAKILWLVKKKKTPKQKKFFWRVGYRLFLNGDSEHKFDDSDDGLVLGSE